MPSRATYRKRQFSRKSLIVEQWSGAILALSGVGFISIGLLAQDESATFAEELGVEPWITFVFAGFVALFGSALWYESTAKLHQLQIFVSYRHADKATTYSICDKLERHFGRKALFLDMDDLHPSLDFRKATAETIPDCRVLVAFMGRRWATGDDHSGLRILNEDDPVMLELWTAETSGVPVIPVFIDGISRVPTGLPPSLQWLPSRIGLQVNPGDRASMTVLVNAIENILGGQVQPLAGRR